MEIFTPKKQSGHKYEKEQKKQRDMQLMVLRHLKARGPMNWELLHVHFDISSTGNIGAAWQDLNQWNYIQVSKEGKTDITVLGLK